MSGFKPHMGNFFDTVGMNRYFLASGIKESVEASTSVVDATESLWNQDYQALSHLGHGATQAFSGLANVGVTGLLASGMGLSRSTNWGKGRTVLEGAGLIAKDKKLRNGYYIPGENGVLHHSTLAGRPLAGAEAKNFMENSKKVDLFAKGSSKSLLSGEATEFLPEQILKAGFTAGNEAHFLKRALRGMGSAKGMGLIIGAQILGTMAFNKASSTIGGMMDEMHLAYEQGKYAHYDTRMFNNKSMQQWGQNAGQAMGQYEMNNMSIARMYHSRG